MVSKTLYIILSTFIFFSCKSTQQTASKPAWFNVAVAEGVEIYVDTANIRHEGAIAYATEKRVYVDNEAKEAYIGKIKSEYAKLKKPQKADKWADFSYCIYSSVYECTNKRFRVLKVEDYDSQGRLISKTSPAKDDIRWLNVEAETVGDYTFFFVCDYQ